MPIMMTFKDMFQRETLCSTRKEAGAPNLVSWNNSLPGFKDSFIEINQEALAERKSACWV